MDDSQVQGEPPIRVTLTTRPEHGALIAEIAGSASVANVGVFEKQMLELLDRKEQLIVLDLENLVFISTLGVAAFIALQKKQHEHGGNLRLARPSPLINDVFKRCKLQDYLQIQPTLEDALR